MCKLQIAPLGIHMLLFIRPAGCLPYSAPSIDALSVDLIDMRGYIFSTLSFFLSRADFSNGAKGGDGGGALHPRRQKFQEPEDGQSRGNEHVQEAARVYVEGDRPH